MPPWLLELLRKNNSAGMVDSLSQILGRVPDFQQMAPRSVVRNGQNVESVGEATFSQKGIPTVNLSPLVLKRYGEGLPQGYRGNYQSTDPNVKLGDAVVQHEFGHLVAYAMNDQPEVMKGLIEAYPDLDRSEEFADSFQKGVQFLRSGTSDMSKLDPKTQAVTLALLKHPLYSGHAINKPIRDFMKLVTGTP